VNPRERLAELGLELATPTPAGSYLPAVRTGSLVFTAGQVPIRDGEVVATGKLGAEVDVEVGRQLARLCALNALAAIDGAVGINSVLRVVKVVGFVASAPGFTAQPKVLDGASELLTEVFGDAGRHARSAVGVAELPLGVPVEVELVVEVT
jgi:enamine deaminase RidA (YjgF/YER057c/UK114 family)